MELNDFDLGWLVGILEGEGCFYTAQKRCGESVSLSTRVHLSSTDRDIVERVVALCGSCVGGPYGPGPKGKKAYWSWNLHGKRAIALMRLVKPFMSKRRQEKITECEVAFEASIERRRKRSSQWLTKLNKTRTYEERRA